MEVCLNIEPFMQPSPAKNTGGDCFACAMTAALRYLFPEKPPTFHQAYDYFEEKGHLSNTWYGMRQALWRAFSDGYKMEITNDLVQPLFDSEQWSHAWWSQFPAARYTYRLEGWLRGGWVAFTEINYAGSGPMTSDGRLNGTDHFVLLDGIKSVWEPFATESGLEGASKAEYVHVVCSAKGVYWMNLRDFLHRHGGSGWWLCRRDER